MCFTPPSAWRDKSYPLVPFLEPATPRDAGAVLLMTLIVEEGGPRSARCSFCESLGQASPTTTTTPRPGTRMVAPQAAGAPCMAALLMPLVMLSSPWAQGRDTPAVHVYQRRSDCYESNGTHRFLERYVYNRDVFVQFDSTVGVFVAVTELGRTTARNWNIQREFLELRRGAVDAVCRHNYELDRAFTLERRVQPKVNVSPSKKGPLQHPDLLVCHVTDFYPGHVQVRWFLNGQEETAGVVSTNLIHNGDWTFQILVMLEMTPQQGDVYTCRVEHPSLDSAVTVEWKAQSDSARSKMLTGVGGFVLGFLALAVSVTLHFRGQRGLRS